MKSNKPVQTKSQLFKATFVVFIVLLASSWLSYFAAYPTVSHRKIDNQLIQASELEVSPTLPQEGIDAKVEKLSSTPESEYSYKARGVTIIVQLVIYIVTSYYLYTFIRHNRLLPNILARKAVGTVAVIMTIASMLSTVTMLPVSSPGLSVEASIWLVIATTVLVAVVSFVIASLCELWYKRRHSFEI